MEFKNLTEKHNPVVNNSSDRENIHERQLKKRPRLQLKYHDLKTCNPTEKTLGKPEMNKLVEAGNRIKDNLMGTAFPVHEKKEQLRNYPSIYGGGFDSHLEVKRNLEKKMDIERDR